MLTTNEYEIPHADKQESRSGWRGSAALPWTIGVLVVLVVGLAALVVVSGDEAAGTTPEQQQMLETIDAYLAGWNDGDETAVLAVMDPNGFYENAADRWSAADGGLAGYVNTMHSLGLTVTRGDAVFLGDTVVTSQETYGQSDSYESIYRMSPDGTTIMWNLSGPQPSE